MNIEYTHLIINIVIKYVAFHMFNWHFCDQSKLSHVMERQIWQKMWENKLREKMVNLETTPAYILLGWGNIIPGRLYLIWELWDFASKMRESSARSCAPIKASTWMDEPVGLEVTFFLESRMWVKFSERLQLVLSVTMNFDNFKGDVLFYFFEDDHIYIYISENRGTRNNQN